jgi:outer membrane protein TolC
MISFLSIIHKVNAQKTLSQTEFFNLVRAYHPVAKQAGLLTRTADLDLMASRGAFDPKVVGNFAQKRFGEKTYFTYSDVGVKLPTWYGIEGKAAYNTASGFYISDENKLPQQGQAVIGITAPLLQGLLIDERRADLFKARLNVQLMRAERDAILNDLFMQAAEVYWKWAFSSEQARIYEQALATAQQRFEAIKRAYILGDRMAMDTLESFTQVQDRQLQFQEAQLELRETTLKLSNFIWNESSPDTTLLSAMPEVWITNANILPENERATMLGNLTASHPVLEVYRYKMDQLNVDLRLKREKLKPKLNIDYNFLGDGFNYTNLFTDNYKWGITFSSSLLLRNERAGVQLAKIKIENTDLLRDQKELEIRNKLIFAFADVDNLGRQLTVMSEQTGNYRRLLELENTRFELGESTFFLINSREMKYLEAQVKLAKLRSTIRFAELQVQWAAGLLR